MKQKGRVPPPAALDHSAALRDRLGRAAWEVNADGVVPWEDIPPERQEKWRKVGQAVMDVIVKRDHRMGQVSISSTFGAATQKPYVELSLDTSPSQFSPAKAREIALMLLEAADAAESDAVLIAFAREQIGLDETGAAQLLSQFRQLREKRRGSEARSA